MHSEHHEPNDIYHQLVKLAADRHTQVIDPPDVALAAFDKARLHPKLLAVGLTVPYTVIVARDQIDTFALSEKDRAGLGLPFVIKPSLGYGRRGLVLDAKEEKDLLRSFKTWPDPQYLLQRRIMPRSLDGEPVYFRAYFVFGSVWCCWWNCYTDCYRMMKPAEIEEFSCLRDIICRIAQITGMRFFSSEIAQAESGEFFVIDYVNDQCHLLTQSASPSMGVPDELVATIARKLVESAQQLVRRAG